MNGKVHSIQSLGTLDGPGVRFVVFLQGCNLRCGCCHNPDTWNACGGTERSATDLVDLAERYKSYFGARGGITLSGGEPLLQAGFAREIFSECKKRRIHTCLDTSGSILNEEVKALLAVTDRVLLDIKYPTDEQYQRYVGCSLQAPLDFLRYLNEQNIPTTLRQVIIPTLNDTDDSAEFLNALAENHPCVDKIELLPFQKICQVKYRELGLPFRFGEFQTPSKEAMEHLESKIKFR
ncbi:MAG: pyruvate formate lyase-activating protein [Clostridia bacterium]|nr:pyruvate formate lyase-activating protein [Clostridia bacterium]